MLTIEQQQLLAALDVQMAYRQAVRGNALKAWDAQKRAKRAERKAERQRRRKNR